MERIRYSFLEGRLLMIVLAIIFGAALATYAIGFRMLHQWINQVLPEQFQGE